MPLQTFVGGTSNTIAFDEERLSVDLYQTEVNLPRGRCRAALGAPEATAVVDYQLPAATINLPFGECSAQLFLPILPDGTQENGEYFGVGLTDLTGGLTVADGTSNTILIGGEITQPSCGLAMREVRVREGQTAYVELRRTQVSNGAISVGWRVVPGSALLAQPNK